MKKVYFACSIRGGRTDAELYAQLVKYLSSKTIVLSEIFADKKLTTPGINKPSGDIWRTDTDWIKEADAVIAEVTNPSLGVGYEIAFAETLGKPILALYQESPDRKLSAMIEGSPRTTVVRYKTITDAYQAINAFIE